jgi:rhodanese-related sulfurtransferase
MEQYQEFVSNHPYLFVALLVTIVMILVTEYQRLFRGFKQLSPLEATQLQNHENAVFLDIRDMGEFSQGHLLDAKNIPLKELPQRTAELNKYKDRPIIAYCASGNRTTQACNILKKEGFSTVHTLAGGVHAWQRASLPMVKK